MILNIYKNCFSRIYIFSPSVDVDATWQPVKDYIEKELKIRNTDEEPDFLNHYDPEALHKIISNVRRIYLSSNLSNNVA